MRDRRYRCSTARIEALCRIQSLKVGARQASRRSIPSMVRAMTFQSAIFQASSALEEYLKQIFDHWLFEIKRNNLPGSSIPSRARYAFAGRELTPVFANFVSSGDEAALAKKIQDRSHLLEFATGVTGVLEHLSGDLAYKNRKYPSPENIKILYKRIGCDNIFDQLSRGMKTNAELKLQAFNDLRTSIAHGNPPDITLDDVMRNLCDVELFVRFLDKINHKELSKDFGGGVW